MTTRAPRLPTSICRVAARRAGEDADGRGMTRLSLLGVLVLKVVGVGWCAKRGGGIVHELGVECVKGGMREGS